jgi:hypothetical protein
MSDGSLLIFVLMLLTALAAYWMGRKDGFDDGFKKGDGAHGAWEEEALWWRENATGIRDVELRNATDD